MISPRVTILAALLPSILTSCGNLGGDAQNAETSPALTPLSQRLNQEQGYAQDSEGNWVPRSDKRSQFDSRRQANLDARNTLNPRSYDTAEYKKTEWTRTRSNSPKRYDGDTDGSRFRSNARAQGQTYRDARTRARTPGAYQTAGIPTNASREDGARRHDRPSDARTDNRREKFVEPEITDWRQQRNLSLDQSRSLLAR